jgi:hypothetical protein
MRSSYIVLAQVHFLTFKTFKIYVTYYSWVSSTRPINVVRLLYVLLFLYIWVPSSILFPASGCYECYNVMSIYCFIQL